MTQFINSYHDELAGFYTELKPTPLKDARLLYYSQPLADDLGLSPDFLPVNRLPFCAEKRYYRE